MNRELFAFIKASPTPYHAVATAARMLEEAGYTALREGDAWTLEPGRGYYVTRNGSSLLAFRIPRGDFSGFMLAAAHVDSPAFKIKENAELRDGSCTRLSVEKYGGMLCATWMDRPLSIAGRVVVRSGSGIRTLLVDLEENAAVIPSVAIHMNRSANENASYNPAVDMLPLTACEENAPSLRERVAGKLGIPAEEILTTDLILYNPQEGYASHGLISAPRLDDLQCAFSVLRGFLDAGEAESLPVCCLFDNEEVGSTTKQGAAGTFLSDVLTRIALALSLDAEGLLRKLAASLMLSCDNAHAVHPNHPEYMDKNHAVYLNKGVVIKYNANQKYTSDAVSAGLFQLLCEEAGVPFQRYANRADMPGGSTLGNIANTQVSLNTVDIGLPQLAMHSAFETAGAEDTASMVKALTCFYSRSLRAAGDGAYTLL